jgi:restriction endonuclease S subunit
MNSYPLVQLGDLANVVAGDPAPQDPQAFATEGPMFVRMQDVGRHHLHPALSDSTDRLSMEWLEQNRLRRFPKDSILIPKSGASVNLNHRAKLGSEAYVVSHLAVVIPDRSKIEPDYLYWWSVRYDPRAQTQVTSLPSLKLSTLKAATVRLPPLDEQRRIVGILNRAAKIERLRMQAAERLREFIPSLFIKMFGDPVENPMGWEEERIGNIGTVGSGAGFPKKEQGVQEEEFPFLKVSDMNLPGNEIAIRSWNNTISDATRQKLRAKIFQTGSVVFPKIGAAIATNKKRMLIFPSCVDNNVMAITPDTDMDSEYLYGLMLQKNLSDFASDADPPSMRKTTVEAWRIPCPPLSLQRSYAEAVESARATTKLAEISARTAVALSASLMNRLLDDFARPISGSGGTAKLMDFHIDSEGF